MNGQTKAFKKQLDSIQKLRQLSINENKDLDIETRIEYAKQAIELSYKTRVDSVILTSNRTLASVYTKEKKYSRESIKLNSANLKSANQLNDSINIVYINMHLGFAYQYLNKRDSAYYYYYNSLKILENAEFFSRSFIAQSAIHINIAFLQEEAQDYMGSEASLIKAIDILLTLPETEENLEYLINSYGMLALNLKGNKAYKKALEYYEKALDINVKVKNNYESQLFIKINIAELYKETESYNKVFKIYNELLEDNTLEKKDSSSYGAILNNMAYTMYLAKDKDYAKIDTLFTKAYTIFDELDLSYELSAGGNDMAEFYYGTNQKDKALFYSKKSYEFGKKSNQNLEVLRALKMLSKLYEGNQGKAYLYEHIKLNDSLIDAERANRNKFARIEFETDQYIKETKRLSTQNILIVVIASILILVFGLIYFIKLQQSKNKRLQYITDQEKANQEIYKLMLQQQAKKEEGRLQERYRISEDLHDGVLSRLFGARMGMGFLDVKGDVDTLKQYKMFMDEMQKIEKEIRDVSHELKSDVVALKANFESIIEVYIKAQSKTGNFKYKIKNEGKIKFESFNETIRVEIYRIIQEAIQNIVKHAKASIVSVSFILEQNTLKIRIEDDGVGFNTEKKHKGIGLKNIASRVLKLEGKLKITSPIYNNKGTELNINIPIQ